MKNFILLGLVMVLMSGCAGTNKRLQLSTLESIAPDGCYYDNHYEKYKCASYDQEKYLSNHQLTENDLRILGSFYRSGPEMLGVFMKLHDCAIKPQDETLICSYEWNPHVVDIFSQEAQVSQKVVDGKYVYVLSPKQ